MTELEYKQLMTNALREIKSLRSQVKQLEADSQIEPIAIIGIGCRFPGDANSAAEYWQNLCDGIDGIDIVPPDRWDSQAYGSKMTTQYGGFIGHLQDFDAAFFGISPKEAASLDPQQRLLLETTWEALEQAGIMPKSLAETQTGVFIGISSNDYSSHLLKRSPQAVDAYLATGNSHSTAAGRIAFTLGLQGPAIAVDTACSSSLVAVHLACQSLRQGESNLAIVGGVNRIFAPEFSINFSEAHMLAPDGHCKTFDRHADGFARGEGGGIVILKRLADVTAEDLVYAVIRGSAVNQDGRSSGLTVPNGPAQRRVIEAALKQANITPEQINYIEAHGTGTALGDPIELGALQQVFGNRSQPLPIGSAKTNLGHLEAAAGIAGLIKTALVLYHRQIPPHLHCAHPTDKFDWANSPLAVAQQSLEMPPIAKAGVSAFGFSGTNAHIVLESSLQSIDRPANQTAKAISFQRQRHWIDSPDPREVAVNLGHPLLGHALAVCDPRQFYAQVLRLNQPQYLADHIIFDRIILPGAGYIELAIAAAVQATGQVSIQLEQIELRRPVEITHHGTTIQVILDPASDRPTWEIHSKTQDQAWQTHAIGSYKINPSSIPTWLESPATVAASYPNSISSRDYYKQLESYGILYGPQFQAIQHVWYKENSAIAQIHLPESLDLAGYYLHPVLLDACFQTIGATVLDSPPRNTFLPIALAQLQLYQSAPAQIWASIELKERSHTSLLADVTLLNELGETIAIATGLRLKAIKPQHFSKNLSALIPADSWQDWLYQVRWQEQLKPINPVQTCAAAIAPQFSQLLARPHLIAYATHLEALENASVNYIVQAMVQLGFNLAPGDRFTTAELIDRLNIQTNHHRLFNRLLQILAEVGYLVGLQSPLEWQLQQWPGLFTPRWDSPQSADVTLLDRCGSQLAEVLRGQVNPMQLLFPNGDWSALTELYQNSPGTQITNELVRRSILHLIESGKDRLRILEIGAGTGGTTAHLLPMLTETLGDRYEYRFTDISPIFLSKAKARFSQYPKVSYQLLNIEQPMDQAFDPAGFDVIIAANALHATQDLAATVQHSHQYLCPGGMLIIVEGVKPARWLDLIFGLTDGWWRYTDCSLRPDYPLIPVSQWQKLLQSHGFSQAAALQPLETIPLGLDQQAVIIAQKQPNHHWFILNHPAWSVAEELRRCDQTCIVQPHRLSKPELIQTLRQAQPDHLIYFSDTRSSFDLHHTLEENSYFLEILQVITSLELKPSLTLVNDIPEAIDRLAPSTLTGQARVAALEYPQITYRTIDLQSGDALAKTLVQELLNPTAETHVRFAPTRQVPRLERYSIDQAPQRLTISAKGSLNNLQWQPLRRLEPQSNQVEIAVKATGLNLIDLLDAIGRLPFERDWFGVELAGEIVALGDGVTEFQLGDPVIALAPGSFQQFVTVAREQVVKQPQGLDTRAAAGIPANFLTAYYGLHQLAQLQPGERILIHSAASGTGMAALQIAQALGAEVYATASPAKWDYLRSLGVEHIFSSRDLLFADGIPRCSIDVVFNALSGDFIPKSLACLRDQGRFIEIGKQGIWTAAQVAEARSQVQYFPLDLMQIAHEYPAQIQQMLQEICHLIEIGKLHPLPYQSFPSRQVVTAFRTMQQAQHIGKIVVDYTDRPLGPFRPQNSYLITGGFGGLGLKVAQWLSQLGAKHILLVGHNPPKKEAEEAIALMQAQGTTIQRAVTDVCDLAAMRSLLESLPLPLDGLFHAAGKLDDGSLQQLTGDRMAAVLAPKVQGGWNLHQITQKLPLRFFVCFSSAAALLGSPGQANHVAANSFLDALAQYRQSLGLPGLSINWGLWSEIGAAAKREVAAQMGQRGIGVIPPDLGMTLLAELLSQGPLIPAQLGAVAINWSKFPQSFKQNPFLSQFHLPHTAPIPQISIAPSSSPFLNRLPSHNSIAYITQFLQTEFAQVLGLQRQPDLNVGFFELGIDSLMTVELQHRLEVAIGQKLSTSVFFEHPNISALAQYIANLLQPNPWTDQRLDDPIIDRPKPEPPPLTQTQAPKLSQIETELLALEALLKN